MDSLPRNPVKLYIQDLFRATQTENRFIYELFGMRFKNVMIHGVVNSVENPSLTSQILEVCDPTGTVNVCYYSKNINATVSDRTIRDLKNNYVDASKFGDPNIQIMTTMMECILDKTKYAFKQGDHVSIVGDIFVDNTKNVRMVSAYSCEKTSFEYDIVWMEELRYLYDKYYLLNKE
ncbi:uncharacterized protein LOC128681098 [Plodia interpunctella]|uniref:uncharacterized protein LOC128681098 n=1 Tax=Plodia interpunctella TaxID=58824 RepID=UPI002368A2A6|nr:uncharacterized protein LOC128681098 [Plodia interpunctella]